MVCGSVGEPALSFGVAWRRHPRIRPRGRETGDAKTRRSSKNGWNIKQLALLASLNGWRVNRGARDWTRRLPGRIFPRNPPLPVSTLFFCKGLDGASTRTSVQAGSAAGVSGARGGPGLAP